MTKAPTKIKTFTVTEDFQLEDDVLADQREPWMRHKKPTGIVTVTVTVNDKVFYSQRFYRIDCIGRR